MYISFPPTLTMMHLCITQCKYWTPLLTIRPLDHCALDFKTTLLHQLDLSFVVYHIHYDRFLSLKSRLKRL